MEILIGHISSNSVTGPEVLTGLKASDRSCQSDFREVYFLAKILCSLAVLETTGCADQPSIPVISYPREASIQREKAHSVSQLTHFRRVRSGLLPWTCGEAANHGGAEHLT